MAPNRPAKIAHRPMALRAVSLWLALSVALLSSLMSEGLPRTTAFGSAFNPATTAVALQPSRTHPRTLADHVRRDDDPTRGQDAVAAIVRAPVTATVPPASTIETAALPISPHPALLRIGLDGSPRGPPLT